VQAQSEATVFLWPAVTSWFTEAAGAERGMSLPGWLVWLLVGMIGWASVSLATALIVGRVLALSGRNDVSAYDEVASALPPEPVPPSTARRRVLIVDDDAPLRLLLRTTFPADEFDVREAASAEEASSLALFLKPDVVVLDVGLPGRSGLSLAAELQARPEVTTTVILLTGADTSASEAREAGAHALLRKPFSPLELIDLVDRLPAADERLVEAAQEGTEQLLVYARDVSRLLEVERRQRRSLQQHYRQATTALADALEARDPSTRHHALRVQRYALELAESVDATLLRDPGLEYGFLLHDIGKVAVPDRILNKPSRLTEAEFRLVQEHPLTGAAILADVAVMRGHGLAVVRSHHERWDGTGYPYGLAGKNVPLAARVFSVADALDAMTSERPYRRAMPWEDAVDEILARTGTQFDPSVVASFARRETQLRAIYRELMPAAA
jgi:ribonuclease P protein subunit RPR2